MRNDLIDYEDAVARLDAASKTEKCQAPTWTVPDPITQEEWATARAAPDCIVDRHLYADVAVRIAPGGMGKTTLMLFEAIHIVLGLPLFGMDVVKPGPVLILTAEDSREMLVARLRSIAEDIGLTDEALAYLFQMVRISDLTGAGFRMTEIVADVVLPSRGIDDLIAACKTLQPVLIVVDPAVSFGVGEARVNDAEQGLVEAARRIRRALNCCVQYIHHSGKANARDKAVDQYAGRGGSAFADGARMVHVLQSLAPAAWKELTGEELAVGETGLILARPKMSYCPPPGDMYIRRRGFLFERVEPISSSKAAMIERHANQVWQLLHEELRQGRKHTRNTLEQADAGDLKRSQIRAALAQLEASGRVEERRRDGSVAKGARTYLHPVASPKTFGEVGAVDGENKSTASPEESSILASPPLREMKRRRSEPPISSPLPSGSPETDGEPTANRANRDIESMEIGL